MAGMERAAVLVGGQTVLADAMGMAVSLLRQKIKAERPIRDEELRCAASALSAHATQALDLSERLIVLADNGKGS